ncbi:hypothetical protein Poli38472_009347 [Pythium oligandrum]|uniref:Ankyrin repeat protein n=1 Tax=Pythium oligandrum TaxID=41045 RepID=A0A8K1CM68_PYTOL|nr:hypothetical protein Poli38472_009347 [Pythium oligandrum]|eukprot:TMW65180.1 hypothetical protein Poli38472_009347 [Pythium oligandrum]
MFDAEELSAAAETGDLATIQRSFAQPGVRPALDQAYEDSRETYEAMIAHNSILYATQQPSEIWDRIHSLFDGVLAHGHIDVLAWMFSATGSALIGDVLSISLFGLCFSAVMTSPCGYEACEVLVSSHVFLERKQVERAFVLSHVLNVTIMSWHTDLIRLVVVHGVDFDNFGISVKCASSGNEQVVETLCESGLSCVSYQAARFCHFSENFGAVQMMIHHGMDVQASEGEHRALHIAAEDANLDLVELYLDQGFADVDA